MFSALVTGSSGRGSSTGRGHCVVLLCKTLYSHSASLTQARYKWVPANLMLGVTLRWTSVPSRGEVEILLVASRDRKWDKLRPGGPLGSYADFHFLDCVILLKR